jgi:sugar phosphate isomerase/epimerase
MAVAIPTLQGLGYSGVEVSLRSSKDVDRDGFFRLLEKHGMELIAIATGQSYVDDGLSLFSSDSDSRRGAVGRIREHIELAAEKNACVIIGGIRGKLASEGRGQYEEGCKAVDDCVTDAEKKGIVLLLEPINRYESNVINTVAEAAQFVEQRGSSCLRILPDTFHMNIEERNIIGSLAQFGKWIGALHCSDNNRLAPGLGHIDFDSILALAATLADLRYIGVEVFPIPESRVCAEIAMDTIQHGIRAPFEGARS